MHCDKIMLIIISVVISLWIMEAQCKSLPQPLQSSALHEKDVITVSEIDPKTEAKAKERVLMVVDKVKLRHLKHAFKTILKSFKEDKEIFSTMKMTFKELLEMYRKEIKRNIAKRQWNACY